MKNKKTPFFGVSKVCHPFFGIFLGGGAREGRLANRKACIHTDHKYSSTHVYWCGLNHDPITRAAGYITRLRSCSVYFRPTIITKPDRLFLIDENK